MDSHFSFNILIQGYYYIIMGRWGKVQQGMEVF